MKRIGTLLMLAGAAIWVLGVVAWLSGVWISLSPAAAKVYVLTLAAITGALLLAAGAFVSRAYRREAVEDREARARARVH